MAEMLIRGDGIERLRRLDGQLRGADRALRAELQAATRAAAQPIVADVRAAVLAISVTSSRGGGSFARAAYASRKPKGGHGLRASIAAATGMQVRTGRKATGVRIVINVSKLPPDQRTLPWALDSATGWRHPVFGDTGVWVKQQGRPYFASTIRRHQLAAAAKIEAAIDLTTAKLTR